MTKLELARTLGQLIRLGLVEPVTDSDQTIRYRLVGKFEGDETPVEAASVMQSVA